MHDVHAHVIISYMTHYVWGQCNIVGHGVRLGDSGPHTQMICIECSYVNIILLIMYLCIWLTVCEASEIPCKEGGWLVVSPTHGEF